jgi:hypothetical protein
MADKKILTRDIPEQVFSEQVGAIFPITITRQNDGKMAVGADLVLTRSLYNPDKRTTEMQRTPTVFKTTALITAAGATVVWAAVTDHRHRILGYDITLAAGTTGAAGCVVTLLDDAAVIATHPISGAALAAPAAPVMLADKEYPANGYLQPSLGKDISVNLSSVLAVGGIVVNIYGTEE